MQMETEELKKEDNRPVEATQESDKTAAHDDSPKVGSGIFMNQFETSL